MWELAKLILIITLIYAFWWLISFFPFLLGLINNVLLFPLNFINLNFYPVSNLPYFVLTCWLIFIVAFFIIRLLNKQ